MNVYALQTSRTLAARGHHVSIFTADPQAEHAGQVWQWATVPLEAAGPDTEGAASSCTSKSCGGGRQGAGSLTVHALSTPATSKDELPHYLDDIATALGRNPEFQAAQLIWAHYWISANAALAAKEKLTVSGTIAAPEHSAAAGADVQFAAKTSLSTLPPPVRAQQQIAVSFHTIGAVKERDAGTGTEPRERLAAEASIAQQADLLVANTLTERDDIIGLLGADPAKVCVAYPGVDHTIFTPAPASTPSAIRVSAIADPTVRNEAELAAGGALADAAAKEPVSATKAAGGTSAAPTPKSPAPHTLLYVGRMQHVKGTDVIIDALALLRRSQPGLLVRLVMIGAGSGEAATSEFEDQARRLGVADLIDFVPPVPPAELVEYYRAADVVVVPSRSESFGFVAAEAAATGAVIVGSDVGGLRCVTDGGQAGVLVEPGSPQALADAIARVVEDAHLQAQLRSHAVLRARQFDWNLLVDTVLDKAAHAAGRQPPESAAEDERGATHCTLAHPAPPYQSTANREENTHV